MNSLLKAFKEFYNEINGATLTGAIDVIVVELADGSFVCSPFHVRFGKLGVLRSREKIVDIEVNGEPVNIHMKLGESGEAFFVQECLDNDLDELPSNLATSPLPSEEYGNKYQENIEDDPNKTGIEVKIRRNSTVLSQSDKEKVYENQPSDYKTRRYSEKVLNRRNPKETKLEYTTEQIRHELGGNEALHNTPELISNDMVAHGTYEPIVAVDITSNVATIVEEQSEKQSDSDKLQLDDGSGSTNAEISIIDSQKSNTKDSDTIVKLLEDEPEPKEIQETKSKKKRRKKSMMKKKASLTSAGSAANLQANTSRKSSSSSSGGSSSLHPSDQNEVDIELNQHSSNATSASIDDLTKSELPAAINENLLNDNCVQDTMDTPRMCDFHFFSDTEVAASPYGSRPSTPIQSDSEFEISQRDSLVKNEKNSDPMSSSTASWKWGEFPITPAKNDVDTNCLNKDAKQAERHSTLNTMLSFMKETIKIRKSTSEGVYLSDLMDNTDGLDPDFVAKYFPPQKPDTFINEGDDHESGNGTSLPHSPSSIENGTSKSLEFDFEHDGKLFEKNGIAFSLCGGLETNGPTDEEFENHLIEYSDVCRDPSIFLSPSLVVRLCGKYYSWVTASSIVMTTIAYRKPLISEAIGQLISSNEGHGSENDKQNISLTDAEQKDNVQSNNRRTNASGYSWWKWRRSTDSNDKNSPPKDLDRRDSKTGRSISEDMERTVSTTINEDSSKQLDGQSMDTDEFDLNGMDTVPAQNTDHDNFDSVDSNNKNDDSISSELADVSKNSFSNEKYRKTLRLTSEQIESLNLKPGMNEVEFSVTTAYQGTSRCKCYLFRWKHTDKVVISDIDGTITKSDVLGHILPMVGKDWAQLGVAELFTKIEKNGYKLLYLSARAIGQSRATRDYLRSIQQGNVKLPDGPLLLNPTSLISAFHREVIERKPEQFKIACLSDIKALFPENPFYAGYGNRINDVWAYCAVGIPVIRIFTINPKGELKHELNKTFQSTYHNMAYIVDQLFPPVNDREESVEFSSFNYWREPVLDISDCDQLLYSNAAITPIATAQHTTIPATIVVDNELSAIPDKA